LRNHSVESEATVGEFGGGATHRRTQRWFTDQSSKRLRHSLRIAHIMQKSRFSIDHSVDRATGTRGNDGASERL
jgi:uracil-DNA glycosylase